MHLQQKEKKDSYQNVYWVVGCGFEVPCPGKASPYIVLQNALCL